MRNFIIAYLVMVFLAITPVIAMTPDEVQKATSLLEKKKDLSSTLASLEDSNTKIVVKIYTLVEKDKECNHIWYQQENTRIDGKNYCYEGSSNYLDVPPSYISDIKLQLNDIKKQLAVLGISSKDCDEKNK